MTTNLAISLLRRGSNGDEILQILETIAADTSDPQPILIVAQRRGIPLPFCLYTDLSSNDSHDRCSLER